MLSYLSAAFDHTAVPANPEATTRSPNALLGATFGVALAATLMIVPGEYWKPTFPQTRLDPQSTWIAVSLDTDPVDRFDLRYVCDGMKDFCPAANLKPQSSPYRDMMLAEYKRRQSED